MRLLVVGEGPNEEHALPLLVGRVVQGECQCAFMRVKEHRKWRIHGRGSGILKLAKVWMYVATEAGYDGLVLVIDEDGRSERRKEIDRAQETNRFPIARACGLAIRSFDAWFLADEQALSQALGRAVDRQPDPEPLSKPKEYCRKLMSNATDDWGLSDFYHAVAQCVDVAKIAERCPKGFRPFVERLRNLGESSN